MTRPLADLMRPQTIDDIVGQTDLLGPNGIVRRMVENGNLSNLLLWGPPGCGKTTIAKALANSIDMDFVAKNYGAARSKIAKKTGFGKK